MNILLLYHSGQTYTNTVFEHVGAFAKFSQHRYFYSHHDAGLTLSLDLSRFDAIVVHYCLRLPYDQISDDAARRIADFKGLKVLFIQDEYDHTGKACDWIRRLGIQLVFTVVPEPQISRIYSPEQFPGVRFVSNLTGYVPEELERGSTTLPHAERKVVIGYRARELSLRYGRLGIDKVDIGRMVKAYCTSRGIAEDVEWTEKARIYGPKWYQFMGSCRAMLGSESGCNVFDWDGTLDDQVNRYRALHPRASDDDIYRAVIEPHEMPGVMNQVSPRVFECVASRTALVLFEGDYSGVVEPWTHYIPLKKDGSNLEVFARLKDDVFLEALTQRAWSDLIAAGRYSYKAFIRMVDSEMDSCLAGLPKTQAPQSTIEQVRPTAPSALTTKPIRTDPPGKVRSRIHALWNILPSPLKTILRPAVRATRRLLRSVIG